MAPQTTLHQSLEREFCPPLDSSLLAALIADIDGTGELQSPTHTQIKDLHTTLLELASQAELDYRKSENFDQLADIRTDETCGTSDLHSGNITTGSTSSSSSSRQPFSSPLEFLQAALPHISTETLDKAIRDHGTDVDEADMEAIVEKNLSAEYLRELEERGFDRFDKPENFIQNDRDSWNTVESPRKSIKSSLTAKTDKRRDRRGMTITLGDIRQTKQGRLVPTRSHSVRLLRRASANDPWTQVSSLSTYISSLLPPHPPSLFQSFFHSPEHRTPYDAMRAALTSLSITQSNSDKQTSMLSGILDILLPSCNNLDSEERSRLISDIHLSLNVTQNRGDDALDLVKVLRELDSDSSRLEMGIYHLPPQVSSSVALPKSTLPLPPPPTCIQQQSLTSPSPTNQRPSPFQWQSVPFRKARPADSPHPLADVIPGYDKASRNRNGKDKMMGARRAIGNGSELNALRRMEEGMNKRNELLREASRAWQMGSAKTRGGEVALYYAERAREFENAAREESLNASRIMVESRRMACQDGTIDLHGTTSAEAITIVKEILQSTGCSQMPLKVITGRGTHSTNRVGVLKPAVKNALVQEGWIVDSWDGGLFVRGKQGHAA